MDLVYKYSNYYYRNLCSEGCPINTKCQWGFCVCNEGKRDCFMQFAWIIIWYLRIWADRRPLPEDSCCRTATEKVRRFDRVPGESEVPGGGYKLCLYRGQSGGGQSWQVSLQERHEAQSVVSRLALHLSQASSDCHGGHWRTTTTSHTHYHDILSLYKYEIYLTQCHHDWELIIHRSKGPQLVYLL